MTNCNRKVAEKIVELCNIKQYIDFITIGSECVRSKPYPDPYLFSIAKYKVKNTNVIIFEDSKSGLLSARQSNVLNVVGIASNYPVNELLNNGANISYIDYMDIDICTLLVNNNLTDTCISRYIKQSLNLNIKDVIIEENKLKGGFISDVIAVKLILEDKELNCVLKLENKNETKLSIMANTLGLYEREYYFYDTISRYINILCPVFYGLIKDDNLNTIGILMDNLNISGNYTLNLNLIKEQVDTPLLIINKLAVFHSKYWNKDIHKVFPELKKHNDKLFNPIWNNFINNQWNTFVSSWKNVISENQLNIMYNLANNFQKIQDYLSGINLTIIHGDVKSPNIFYKISNKEPVFIDWQYVAIGKGVQDIVFFLIESFDIQHIKINLPIFKYYYYSKLLENGIMNYSYEEYEKDFKYSLCYFPFFVAIWFGTTPFDDLIDKNFPYFFIQKLGFILEYMEVHIV